MAGNGRIVMSGVLLAALLSTVTLGPRPAVAEPDRRGNERREMREAKRDHDRDGDRHDDRNVDRRYDRRGDRHNDQHHDRRGDRRHDRDGGRYCDHGHPHRGPAAGGHVRIRVGARPVVYCPPPPRPARIYYDPYLRMRFTSLALAADDAFRHGRVAFVWVLEGGEPRFAYQHVRGGWQRCDDWWPR